MIVTVWDDGDGKPSLSFLDAEGSKEVKAPDPGDDESPKSNTDTAEENTEDNTDTLKKILKIILIAVW